MVLVVPFGGTCELIGRAGLRDHISASATLSPSYLSVDPADNVEAHPYFSWAHRSAGVEHGAIETFY